MPTYIQMLGDILEGSVRSGKAIQDTVLPDVPHYLKVLKEMAEGVAVNQHYVTRKGEVKTRVYEVPPNLGAIAVLMRLASATPKEAADTLLSIARAEATVADEALKLAQRDTAIESARSMARNRIASDRSLVDEKSVEKAMSGVTLRMLGFIQSLHIEDYPSTEAERVRFVERYKDRSILVLNEELDSLPGQGGFGENAGESDSGDAGGNEEDLPEEVSPPKKRRGRPPKKREEQE